MNHCFDDYNPEELLEDLRRCAHQLLLAYGETLQKELWIASEKAAEACQCLLPLVHDDSSQHIFH